MTNIVAFYCVTVVSQWFSRMLNYFSFWTFWAIDIWGFRHEIQDIFRIQGFDVFDIPTTLFEKEFHFLSINRILHFLLFAFNFTPESLLAFKLIDENHRLIFWWPIDKSHNITNWTHESKYASNLDTMKWKSATHSQNSTHFTGVLMHGFLNQWC